ncbi:Na/Pi cotransporter family protein [Curvivirga sp.]|uniref:Na/Pi cotransporter family protein n=1 Tax=Curvivirga sp. TaxID=2856848 RepID=UPI003B5AEA20
MSATSVLIQLLGTIALLLWGMRMVRTGVQRGFGSKLRSFLGEWLSNRFAAFGAGLGVTAILQSSTATCLMVADFASRNIVILPVALAIMLGADVGTALVAQILSLNFSWLSPVLIFVGFVVFTITTSQKKSNIGRIAIGLGIILLSLKSIVGVSEPLRNSETLVLVINALAGEPLVAVLLVALLTWAAHSSLAIVLLVCSMASTGAIPVELGMVLILGANLGGALPPIFATLYTSPAGRRVAIGNGIFKLLGCILIFPFLSIVERELTPYSMGVAGLLINLHLVFNVGLAFIFMPFTSLMDRLLKKVIVDQDMGDSPEVVRYLDMSIPIDATLGLSNASREVLRMGDELDHMLKQSFNMLHEGDSETIKEISKGDDVVDELYEAVKVYLTEIRKEELDEQESQRCGEVMAFCANLEHIGDIIDKNLLATAMKLMEKNLSFSEAGLNELEQIHQRVHDNLRLAMGVFMSQDISMARRLILEKETFRQMEHEAANSHMERFQAGRPETLETSSLHLDVIRDLKRINSHLTSVAYPILDQAGELRKTRLRKKFMKMA